MSVLTASTGTIGPAGFQDDEITRPKNSHQRNPGSKRRMIATMVR
jgi:hypothetical protein